MILNTFVETGVSAPLMQKGLKGVFIQYPMDWSALPFSGNAGLQDPTAVGYGGGSVSPV